MLNQFASFFTGEQSSAPSASSPQEIVRGRAWLTAQRGLAPEYPVSYEVTKDVEPLPRSDSEQHSNETVSRWYVQAVDGKRIPPGIYELHTSSGGIVLLQKLGDTWNIVGRPS